MSNEARTDVYRRRCANLAVYDQTDFSCAAPDVDVQQGYSLSAASPVIMTAPVSISSRLKPAAWKVSSTSSFSGSASIFQSPLKGVNKIGERAITFRSRTIGFR